MNLLSYAQKFSGRAIFFRIATLACYMGFWASAKMEEFSFDVDEFNFLYGFLFGRKRMDSNKVDIHYAISRLMFTVECKSGFTPKQLSAIKNHYGKNEALMSLKQEKVIMEITYV